MLFLPQKINFRGIISRISRGRRGLVHDVSFGWGAGRGGGK